MKAKFVKEELHRASSIEDALSNKMIDTYLNTGKKFVDQLKETDLYERALKAGYTNGEIELNHPFNEMDEDEWSMVQYHLHFLIEDYDDMDNTLIVPVKGEMGKKLLAAYNSAKLRSKDVAVDNLDGVTAYVPAEPIRPEDYVKGSSIYSPGTKTYKVGKDRWHAEILYDLDVLKLVFWGGGKVLTFIVMSSENGFRESAAPGENRRGDSKISYM